MAVKIAEAFVRLFVKKGELSKGLGEAKAETQSFASAASSLAKKAAVVTGVYLGVKAIISYGQAALESADRLAKLSTITGLTVEDISRLGYAATLSGSDTESLATSLRFLAQNSAEAAQGSEGARRAFAAVGVTMQDLKAKSPQELLLQIADAFASGRVSGDKAAAAMQLFGRAGAELVPLLSSGSAGIKKLTDEADRLGVTVSSEFAQQAEVFNDKVAVMKARLSSVATTIMASALPALTTLAKYVGGEFSTEMGKAGKSTEKFDKWMKVSASGLIMFLHGLEKTYLVLRLVKDAMTNDYGAEFEASFKRYKDDVAELSAETQAAVVDIWAPDAIEPAKRAAENLGSGLNFVTDAAAKLDLQLKAQNLQLQLQAASMRGDATAVRELSAALDQVAAEQMKLQGASPEGIAEFLRLSGEIRGLEEEERRRSVYAAEADLGRQLVNLAMDRESAMREIEQQAHRERVIGYEAMLATAEEKEALIAQSHELMMAKLREMDIDYGVNWSALWQQMLREYDTTGQQMVSMTKRVVSEAEGLFSDVLFAGIMGDMEGVKDAFKGFLKSMLREITNFMAKQAVIALIKWFANSKWGSGGGSSGVSIGDSGRIITSANGNVLRGGFRAFASGGIVNRPTFGLIGEGKYNEAVVPLPDGRSIPVEMGGGGRPPIDNHITVVLAHEFMAGVIDIAAARATPSEGRIVQIVGRNILENGTLRAVIRNA